ncbi:unnamed protein product [Leptidea sinapis]|uniref:Uncharacterized protein n=1 Tax=Leptidea sinapis TaxID=189913 RepID=A0A5E4QKI4_9NEOP|nr:unnamed protein product [Leptidea sinapis]
MPDFRQCTDRKSLRAQHTTLCTESGDHLCVRTRRWSAIPASALPLQANHGPTTLPHPTLPDIIPTMCGALFHVLQSCGMSILVRCFRDDTTWAGNAPNVGSGDHLTPGDPHFPR